MAGRNCWRIESADRAALLVDGDAYFRAILDVLAKARHSIFIVGWDLFSRFRLVHDEQPGQPPVTFIEFLKDILARQRTLHVYVLSWDYSMLFALEREWLPELRLGWNNHNRLHFSLDDSHPFGASHHQKIVVADDAVAFAGGFDLTQRRWDTPDHLALDPRRIDPDGKPYPPFHDIQMMVEGNAAHALGRIARARWRRATGHDARRPAVAGPSLWPEKLKPDFAGIRIGIARTDPGSGDTNEAVTEVRQLFLDSIAMARRFIYIETQYLTSHAVGRALASRLREDHGPEIVIVTAKRSGGWLEQGTMDVIRSRLLGELKTADRHGRLRVYYPDLPGLGDECLTLHSKLMTVDDVFLRVGSANLTNRSMGLDTECDLAIEAGHPEDGLAIEGARNRLLAEHLGTTPSHVDQAIRESGSLIAAIEVLRGTDRTLRDVENTIPEFLDRQLPESAMLDPERPIDAEKFIQDFLSTTVPPVAGRRGLRFALLLILFSVLAALWRFTPLRESLDIESLESWAGILRNEPLAPLAVLTAFAVGGLVSFPVTLLVIASALIFAPLPAIVYSLAGSLLSAALTYGIGLYAGKNFVRGLVGSGVNRISRRLARRGVLTVTAIRLVPVAPFTVINLIAGASHIRFWDFILGTLLGMGPGVILITLFIDRLVNAIGQPNPALLILVAVAALIFAASMWRLKRWIDKKKTRPDRA